MLEMILARSPLRSVLFGSYSCHGCKAVVSAGQVMRPLKGCTNRRLLIRWSSRLQRNVLGSEVHSKWIFITCCDGEALSWEPLVCLSLLDVILVKLQSRGEFLRRACIQSVRMLIILGDLFPIR